MTRTVSPAMLGTLGTFTGGIIPAGSTHRQALQALVDAILSGSGGSGSSAVAHLDTFTGNGTKTQFNLSFTPSALSSLMVSIGGVVQIPTTDYTWSTGTTLTFTEAPGDGLAVLVHGLSAYEASAIQNSIQDIYTNASNIASLYYGATYQAGSLGEMLSRTIVVTGAPFYCPTTGTTSAVTAIQNALNYCAASGGGMVLIPVGRYLIDGQITIPSNVLLRGMACGPYDHTSLPTAALYAPTFLITYTGGPAIVCNSAGSKVSDLLFYWPNQVAVTASTPTAYPYAISVPQGMSGNVIERNTFVNAYNAIEIQTGRASVRYNNIGAFNIGIFVDHALDFTNIHFNKDQPFWDIFSSAAAFPQPIDTWVLTNHRAIVTARVDRLSVVGHQLIGGMVLHDAIDSPDTTQADALCGYGTFTDCEADYVVYGVRAKSARASSGGFSYINCGFKPNKSGAGPAAVAAVQTVTGGTQPPYLYLSTCTVQGDYDDWSVGATKVQNLANPTGGLISVADTFGINDLGAVAANTLPASTVVDRNFYPFKADVYIIGGTITEVKRNGTSLGVPRTISLEPGDSYAITYSVAPTMTWFAT